MIPALALTRRGRGFVIAAAAVWASWFVIGLRDIWYLTALLAATVVLSIVAALIAGARAASADGVQTRISVTDATPTVGRRVVLTAVLQHGLRFTLHAQAVWEVAGRRVTVPVAIGPGRTAMIDIEWRPTGRGRAEARVAALLVADPLGLVLRRVRCADSLELLALPRPLDALPAPAGASAPESTDGSESRVLQALSTGTPGGAVREYRSGDAPRQIHWKQSARQGELLVNLQEHNAQSERALWLDRDREAYESEARFNLAVSAAATLAAHWIGEGHAVGLHLDDEAVVVCTSEGQALRALATVELRDGPMATARETGGLPPVVVTGTVSQRLAERLRLERYGGDVYIMRGSSPQRIPDQWRPLTISGRPSGPGDETISAGRGAR